MDEDSKKDLSELNRGLNRAVNRTIGERLEARIYGKQSKTKSRLKAQRLHKLEELVGAINQATSGSLIIQDQGYTTILEGFASSGPYYLYTSLEDWNRKTCYLGGLEYDNMRYTLDGLWMATRLGWRKFSQPKR